MQIYVFVDCDESDDERAATLHETGTRGLRIAHQGQTFSFFLARKNTLAKSINFQTGTNGFKII